MGYGKPRAALPVVEFNQVRGAVERFPAGEVVVEAFGLVPDDDTAGATNDAAWTNAEALAAQYGLPLRFAKGETYYFTSALTITKNGQIVRGPNTRKCVIRQDTASANGFEFNGDSGEGSAKHVLIENLRVQGVGSSTSTGHGLHFDETNGDGDWVQLLGVEVRGFDVGVYMDGYAQSILNTCRAQNNRVNYEFSNASSDPNTILMLNSANGAADETGMIFDGGAGVTVIGGDHGSAPKMALVKAGAKVMMIGGNFESAIGGTDAFIDVETNGILEAHNQRFLLGSGADIPCYRVAGNSYAHISNPNRDDFTTSPGVLRSSATATVRFDEKDASGNFTAPFTIEDSNGEEYVGNGFVARPDNAIPTAAANMRGMVLHVVGRSGVAPDKLQICLRDSSGSYSWVTIATA